MPATKLTPRMNSTSATRKPVRLSERCGVSSAEKRFAGSSGRLCSCSLPVMHRQYTRRSWRRKSTRKGEIRSAKPAKARPSRCKPKARRRPRQESTKASKPWTPAEVDEAFSRFRKANPEPKGELEHRQPLHAAGRGGAVGAGDRRRRQQGDARAVRAGRYAAEDARRSARTKLRDYIKTIGLYRNKAKNVIALSEKLIAEFGGEVPRTRDELETLPGVGPQDRQCRAQHGLRRAHHGGRHACVPRRQPHRAGAGQDAA